MKVGLGRVLNVKVVPLAVKQIIGHRSIKSTAHMNKAVGLFLEKVEQVNKMVEMGISVNRLFSVQMAPLMQPAAKITLSNFPPLISNGFLLRELSHGKESPIRHGKVSGRSCRTVDHRC